jgi:hypothetical protein
MEYLMNEKSYPEGVDCVWLASDRAGYLGAFVTGGTGPIPIYWLNHKSIQIEDVEEVICQLPKISDARMLVTIKRPDSFIELASKGIFVYDWRDVHRTTTERLNIYEPVTVPSSPMTSDMLPAGLSSMAKALCFKNVTFADNQPIDARMHANCRDGV